MPSARLAYAGLSTWFRQPVSSLVNEEVVNAGDPCAAIAGRKWISPREARECMFSFPGDDELKANIIQVANKTLPFHTSVNYQILAPHPFENDVHEDIAADLARIDQTSYRSEFDFHLDIYRSFRRLNDGHCTLFNLCYDSLYIQLPAPTPRSIDCRQMAHRMFTVAPEAFTVASAEFPDQIEFWQNSLPDHLKGRLSSVSGAQVLQINGADPFLAVNENAQVTGTYQSFGTRQNAFFSSYSRGAKGWSYIMGNFAQQIHPLNDFVELTIQRINSSSTDKFTIPYRSRFGSAATNFTDGESYRANNCVSRKGTNGYNFYDAAAVSEHAEVVPPAALLQQQPTISSQYRRHPVNVLLDATSLSDVELPEELLPSAVALNESYSVAQFYLLDDNVTGVLALGSFSAANFTAFMGSLLDGLQELKSLGATRLIVDVCYPTTHHSGRTPPNVPYAVDAHWLRPTVNLTINGHNDTFSPRYYSLPFEMEPPKAGLFDPKNIVIISNGRCGSSCSLFSVTMSKLEGVKTAVLGGKQDVPQQYCGVVGGQSTHFSEIDTEIKSTQLKNHTLAPPDFVLGITWRLGFGVDDPKEPEEWQDHPADFNIPLTMSTQVPPFYCVSTDVYYLQCE
ncbi:hypothetical protein C8R46DRAFT_1157283 [Mycena filopes]|nr:hypothetical protein C8R46DRAFT_1157283 [Mycena filopes]